MSVRADEAVAFGGPHSYVEAYNAVDGFAAANLLVSCAIDGPHSHPTHREWADRRLFLWRSYDATVFDEWTLEKRKRLKPLVRQLFWRPGSDAERAYDTRAYVEKLGQVTDSGVCIDCGGTRRRQSCDCGSPTTRRRRSAATAATGKHAAP
jgi:hypothetical protein